MNKLFLRVCRFVYKIIGLISPLFKILVVHSDIESLEKRGKYVEARELRHKYLNCTNKKYLAPLWRQEGFDLLYQVKDYQSSVKAFQNAIETIELSPALYGVAGPLDIYFGASIASASINDIKKTEYYFSKFNELFKSMSKNPKLEKALRNYKEGIQWLNKYLLEHTGNK